ncbi:MAG: PIN domain-containing protein [Gammaproteobacteria bacterium]
MTVILDACAIIAYFRDEPGAEVVEEALLSEECFVHSLNLCEVYRDCLLRGESVETADGLLDDLANIGVTAREDMDVPLWKHVASIKHEIKRIAYNDCFALATTTRLNGVLYTSDHHELDRVAADGKHAIRFIR